MDSKKRLIENFLSLSSVQFAGYIFPLLTVPYLLRVLGPEKFGLLIFAQAIIQYFVTFSNYGFNLTAVREISVNRDDRVKVSEIFCAVMVIKFIFLLMSFLILFLLCNSVAKFKNDYVIYYLTFGIAIGGAMFPIWLFQGLEKMKLMAILSFFPKVFFTLMVFIFIKTENDYLFYPVILSLGFFFTGLISIWIIVKELKIKILTPSIKLIKYHLKEGWFVFISLLGNSLYSTSNVFILGMLTNNVMVGYFSAAEKIVRAISSLMMVSSQTIYPHIGKLASESKEVALKFARKIFLLVGIPNLLISCSLFLFARQIGDIFFGKNYEDTIIIIRILSFMPIIAWVGNFCSVQIMLNFNFKKQFSKIIISAGIFNLIFLFPLIHYYQHFGTAWSLLITEFYITIISFTYVQTHNLKIIGS